MGVEKLNIEEAKIIAKKAKKIEEKLRRKIEYPKKIAELERRRADLGIQISQLQDQASSDNPDVQMLMTQGSLKERAEELVVVLENIDELDKKIKKE